MDSKWKGVLVQTQSLSGGAGQAYDEIDTLAQCVVASSKRAPP